MTKGNSNTQRTLQAIKAMGYKAGMVERFIGQAWNTSGKLGIRKDLFGILDIIAMHPTRGVIGIQSTGQDYSGHHKKITEEHWENACRWLLTPGTKLELWAWRKVLEKRGGKRRIWKPRIKKYHLGDFPRFDPLDPRWEVKPEKKAKDWYQEGTIE